MLQAVDFPLPRAPEAASRLTQVTMHEGDEVYTWVASSESVAWAKVAAAIIERMPYISSNWGIGREDAQALIQAFSAGAYDELAEVADQMTNGELYFSVEAAEVLTETPELLTPEQFAASLSLAFDPSQPALEVER